MLDYAVITAALVLASTLYILAFESSNYIKLNLGMPLIVAFVATLLVSGILLFIDKRSAYLLSEYSYYLLLIGLILQAASYIKAKNGGSSQ